MYRRKLIFLLSGGLIGGVTGVRYSTFNQKSLAVDYSILELENVKYSYASEPDIFIKFDKLDISATNIDSNKNLNIKLKAGLSEDIDVVDLKTYDISEPGRIEDILNENRLRITNDSEDNGEFRNTLYEQADVDGWDVDIITQIEFEWDGATFETSKETINIEFAEKETFPKDGISHHFPGTYGASTSSSSIDIRETEDITEESPEEQKYTIETEFVENGSYAGDESADYELGVQLLDEEDNVVDSMSTKWTFNNSGTETGTDSTTFSPEENYSWRFYVGSNGATDTRWSPNNPDNEGFITLYAEDE